MRNRGLKRTVLFLGIGCMIFYCRLYSIHADAYYDGLITVKHSEFAVIKNRKRIQFNHPYKLPENAVANILSSLYYKEKGLFKRKGTLRVFQDEEVKKLAPLIAQTFSNATPTQVVILTSYSYRLILTDRKNSCVLFAEDHSLNIAFTDVHTFQTFNDFMSEKKKYLVTRENPVKKTHSSFWKLIPSSGQRLEPGHENWLIIDLPNEIHQ